MQRLTHQELSRFNGKDGSPAYIAYRGKVYDVSSSYHWRNGRHQVVHKAGMDLTASLEQAPHGADLIEKFPVVAELCEDA